MVQLRALLRRLFLFIIPTSSYFRFFLIVTVLSLFVSTFGYLFLFLGHTEKVSARSASTDSSPVVDSIPDSFFNYLTVQVAGCVGLYGFGNSMGVQFSPLTQSTGVGRSTYNLCNNSLKADITKSSNNPTSFERRFILMDFGATGMLINAGSSLYDVRIAAPGETVNYYASRMRGVAYATDDPTSGRSVLAPVFILNQNLVNLAYGLVVILLLTSSFSLLISNLTGENQSKVSLVQLIINSVVTLIVITFYYEIGAIIYDLTVNYGNALVAGLMSPFINSFLILERLSPGGDISVVNILNAYQFVGVSDGFLIVVNSILYSLLPLLQQTGYYVTIVNDESVNWILGMFGAFMAFIGGVASTGAGAAVLSMAGNNSLFATVIAWMIFILNLKIFFNLLFSFIAFSMMVAFGPLISLGGISEGFEGVKESFKRLAATGLVYPVTFLFILLAGVAFNIHTPDSGEEGGVYKQELCRFSSTDPASRGIVNNWGGELFTGGYSQFYNPYDFMLKNSIYQNIIDVVPARIITEDGVRYRDCRPSLFPTPWTFIPAPFGTIGQRDLQIQVTDGLVRTFLGVIFIFFASQAPDFIKKSMGVGDDMFGLIGIKNVVSEGFQKTFSFGFGLSQFGASLAGLGLKYAPSVASRVPYVGGFVDRFSRNRYAESVASRYNREASVYRSVLQRIGYAPKAGQMDTDELAKKFAREKLMGDLQAARGSPIAGVGSGGYGMGGAGVMFDPNTFSFVTEHMTAFGRLLDSSNSALQQFIANLQQVTGELSRLASAIDVYK